MNTESTFIPQGHYSTVQQVAHSRGVSRQTVQNWIGQGWITSIQIPGLGHLIPAEAIKDFIPPKQGPKVEAN